MNELPELPIYSFTPDLGGLLTFVINLLLPLLVGVVTTRVTSSNVKAVLLLALSAVAMLVTSALRAVASDVPWEWIPLVMNVGIAFGFAVLAHFGLWKPSGASRAIQSNVGVKAPPQ